MPSKWPLLTEIAEGTLSICIWFSSSSCMFPSLPPCTCWVHPLPLEMMLSLIIFTTSSCCPLSASCSGVCPHLENPTNYYPHHHDQPVESFHLHPGRVQQEGDTLLVTLCSCQVQGSAPVIITQTKVKTLQVVPRQFRSYLSPTYNTAHSAAHLPRDTGMQQVEHL